MGLYSPFLFPYGGVKLDKTNSTYWQEMPTYFEPDTTKKEIVIERPYTADESILTCRSFFALSTSDTFANQFYVDHEFYVSSISTISKEQFEGRQYYSDNKHSWDKNTYPFTSKQDFYIELNDSASQYYRREIKKFLKQP